MHWTASEIAAAVNGALHGPDLDIDSATQDSREVSPDRRCLFVALAAERDGHDFIPAAIDSGAAALIASRPISAPDNTAVIEVADTSEALAALGSAARDRLSHATVIGVTGSVGKTTTKDFLASVLATSLRTHANTRSFNNEIGVPLTLIDAALDSEAVVIEMGSRGPGHIADLCRIARPTIGVITTVGTAHTSEFGDVDTVARAKAELVAALPANGLAVLNADVALVAEMADSTNAEVVTYGLGTGPTSSAPPTVRAENIKLDEALVPTFDLVAPQGSISVRLGACGIHLVGNALAAAAVGLHLGLTLEQVAAGLAAPVVSPMRMDLIKLAGGVTIVDDSYNANPISIEAAIRSLAALPAGRRVAVLGVMAELGAESDSEHARMGDLATDLGISVIAVGAPAYGGHDVSATGDAAIDEAMAALDSATDGLAPGTAVLVKGSRVAGLERLVERLRRRSGG